MYELVLQENHNPSHHLLNAFFLSRALDAVLATLVARLRRDHVRAGRPRQALLQLMLTADGLREGEGEFPIVTSIGPLFGSSNVAEDLLGKISRVLSSKQTISLRGAFAIQATIVDEADPALIYLAGPGRKTAGRTSRPRPVWKVISPQHWGHTFFQKSTMTFLMPDLSADPVYQDCCLLAAIVFSLSYKEFSRQKALGLSLKSRDWGKIKQLGREDPSKRAMAWIALRTKMDTVVRESDLSVAVFANVTLGDALRQEVDKLNIRLEIYDEDACGRPIFAHPVEYIPDRPLIMVLAVATGTEPRESEVVLHHAAAALKECGVNGKNLSSTRFCRYCYHNFSSQYFPSHKCRNAQYPRCRTCGQPVWNDSVYLDSETRLSFCFQDPQASAGECERCRKPLHSKACQTLHTRYFCTVLSVRCDTCGEMYKRAEQREHQCGDYYCRVCKKMCNVNHAEEKGGESATPHTCTMVRPTPHNYMERLAFFDTETRLVGDDHNEHRVNAVGLSFESATEPGVFSEIYFYDDTMGQEEEDSHLREDVFRCQYWSDSQSPAQFKRHTMSKKRLAQFDRFEDSDPKEAPELGGGETSEATDAAVFICAEATEAPSAAADPAAGEEEDDATPAWADPLPPGHGGAYGDSLSAADVAQSALTKFVDYILHPRFYGTVFIAHASSRFDSILLLHELLRRHIKVEPLFDGNKALQLRIPHLRLRFIDSYRYIKLPLHKFATRFPHMPTGNSASAASAAKGVFPFRINREDMYDYAGPLPDESWFVDEFTSEKGLERQRAFREAWPAGQIWCFRQEMHAYLRQDVRVLRGGCLEFLKEFTCFQEDLNQRRGTSSAPTFFYPFNAPFFTVSSFVHSLWQHFSMPEGQIFLLSNQRNARKTSRGELEWLSHLDTLSEHPIRHALSHAKGQAKLGPYYPDGLMVDAEGRQTVFEFLGCAVHYHAEEDGNCPLSRSFLPGDRNPFGIQCSEAYRKWCRKKRYYESHDISLVARWECQHNRAKAEEPALKQFLEEQYYVHGRPAERLRLRSGLRGGRTECFRMSFLQELNPDRRLYYIDKNSLYPAVAIINTFPIGQPEVWVGREAQEVTLTPRGFERGGRPFVGLMQTTLLPPASLFLPVLPFVSAGKLKFGLCRTCVDQQQQSFCRHTDQQRAITDVWTTAEVEYAIECGYILLRLWEVFAYRETSPLFRDFYTYLARIKLESEGFPDDSIMTPEAQAAYVDGLNQAMPGLNLEVGNVKRNMSRREFAKFVSNIALGKFSQSAIHSNAVLIRSHPEWRKLRFESPHLVLKSFTPLTETLAEVVMEPKEEALGFARNTQVVLYAFVTAYARIGMMRDMRRLMRLGARLYYTDTDSIIFDYPLSGDLAALEQEFQMGSKAYNAYKYETRTPLVSFACLGPKNYSFTTEDGQSELKSRGFTLESPAAKAVLNHQSMRGLLDDFLNCITTPLKSESFNMKINRQDLTVKNTTVVKQYVITKFDKRWLARGQLHDQTATLPYGAKHADFEDTCAQREFQ